MAQETGAFDVGQLAIDADFAIFGVSSVAIDLSSGRIETESQPIDNLLSAVTTGEYSPEVEGFDNFGVFGDLPGIRVQMAKTSHVGKVEAWLLVAHDLSGELVELSVSANVVESVQETAAQVERSLYDLATEACRGIFWRSHRLQR